MSIEHMTYVWKYSEQSGSGLLLLLAIADFTNEEGVAWPSIDTLAEKSRVSRRTVIDKMAECRKAGELQIEEGAGPRGTNLYRIMLGWRGANSAPLPEHGETPEVEAPDVGGANSARVQNGDADLHPNRKEPKRSTTKKSESKDPNDSGANSAPQSAPLERAPELAKALDGIRANYGAKADMSGSAFKRYFEPLVLVKVHDDVVALRCESDDQMAWLYDRGIRYLEQSFKGALGRKVAVRLLGPDEESEA